jgi:hypothetical protein
MDWIKLVNTLKWPVCTIVALVILYKPLSRALSKLKDLWLKRKEFQIGATFERPPHIPPRTEKLDSLITLIKSTGANVEKLAIECLLQEYVSNSSSWPEKLAIGNFLTTYCLQRATTVILDTGTTVAAVATQMMAKPDWPDLVITNSVTTAAFISVTKSIHTRSVPRVYMPPGILHAEYRGSYLLRSDLSMIPDNQYNDVIHAIQAIPKYLVSGQDTIYGIVAATYFSAKYGPGANSDWNRKWKRDTFELADTIIICIDISKVGGSTNGIFSEDEWIEKLRSKDVKIIVAGTPDSLQHSYMITEFKTIRNIENQLNKTLLYHGEIKGDSWVFTTRNECLKLAWGSQTAKTVCSSEEEQ